MKFLQENRFLAFATGLSVAAHALALTVHFVAPKNFKIEPTDPGLEVILVNAKHDSKPLKAEALAQANLDGGGNADAGRAKSPLPDLRKMESGDSVKASRRRIQELEEMQKNLLTQIHKSPLTAPPVTEKEKPDPTPTGADLIESSKAIARMAAEITQTIDDQNKRPKKTFITPSTREVGYAEYYKTLQRRVEEIGTLNFPQKNGRKLYGELVVYIPIFQDGTIYMKDGGTGGRSALSEAEVALMTMSKLPWMPAKPQADSTPSPASAANCCTSASAVATVRLAITSVAGRCSRIGSTTPRAAPPAPSSSTRLPAIGVCALKTISVTRPAPSVLSPIMPSSLKTRVLTAPAAWARTVSAPASLCASSLKGTVTLAPLPPSAMKARTASAKPSTGARRFSYLSCWPVCAA